MTTATIDQLAPTKANVQKGGFDISPTMRNIVKVLTVLMCLTVGTALFRGLTGLAPEHPNTRSLAIMIHVSTVVPCIPLGAYLLLTRKGTKLHKQLGKVWVMLMVTTATSAIFIKTGGSFSFIHIFVPITFHAAWQIIATARKGDMAGHKKHVTNLFLYALMIPGLFSFLPDRLMGVWFFG